jgi:hypothetical protein
MRVQTVNKGINIAFGLSDWSEMQPVTFFMKVTIGSLLLPSCNVVDHYLRQDKAMSFRYTGTLLTNSLILTFVVVDTTVEKCVWGELKTVL